MSLFVPTYIASVKGLVVGATPQDIFVLQSAPGRTVFVSQVRVCFTQTTPSVIDILLLKRSTPNSGGTFTSQPIVQFDSTDVPSLAQVMAYTANPASLGTSEGVLFNDKIFGDSTGQQSDRLIWNLNDDSFKQVNLQPGGQESLCLNLNGIASPAGNSFDITVIWVER